MFFTLGLTADVASAHRHEFSSPPAPQSQQRISSPRRSPFPIPRPPQPPAEGLPPVPATPPLPRASVGGQVRSLAAVMVTEPTPDSASERALSRSNSTGSIVSSITSVGGRARNVILRSKTSYQLAHPPPAVHRPRLGVRPKLLLQLQRLSGSARPTPTLDVLPSTIFAPRLARSFPRFFTGKDGFFPNDILVVTSEDYAPSSPGRGDVGENLEDDNLGTRQLVAAICQVRKGEGAGRGKAEICLGNGPTWEATPLLNGGYELVSKDANGSTTTVRWIQRKPANRRRSSTLQGSTSARPDEYEKRFVFSIISPDTRRHPIIASMNRTTIDISDYHSTSSPSPILYSPTSPSSPPVRSAHSSFSELQERTLIRTGEPLKTLILTSGIWVAFREGWSQNFKYNDASASPSTNTLSGSSNVPRTNRCCSMPLNVPENNREPRADELGGSHQSAFQSVGGRFLRSGGQLLHRSTAPQTSGPTVPREGGVSCLRRANSTGTAFGHNKTGPKIREIGSTFTTTPLGDSEGEDRASLPSPSTPSRRQPVLVRAEINGGSEYLVSPTPEAGHCCVSRRRVQSAYYPKAMGSVEGGYVIAPRAEEGEKKLWNRLKNIFGMVRRTGGIPTQQR
ncbi:MAG: hypothetical protein M1840_003332 [Geoglossum simile]|nr:MAG: hypothetical protein M1840_003332 [Geoglossum simile]